MTRRVSAPRLRAVEIGDRVSRETEARPAPSNEVAKSATPGRPRRARLTVTQQVGQAFKAGPVAAVLGFAFGGTVPYASHEAAGRATRFLVNGDMARFWIATAVTLGCLLFSAPTVTSWGREAFGSKAKAIGLVVLLEALLVFGHTLELDRLSWVALGLLGVVNATSAACRLARVS